MECLILRGCWLVPRQACCGWMQVSCGSENRFRRFQRGAFLSVMATPYVFSAVCEVSRRDGHRRLLVLHVCAQFMFPVGDVSFQVKCGTQNCEKGSCGELS